MCIDRTHATVLQRSHFATLKLLWNVVGWTLLSKINFENRILQENGNGTFLRLVAKLSCDQNNAAAPERFRPPDKDSQFV